MKATLINICEFLKKWLWCRWFHRKHMCFPEVWDRGLDGPWHCMECHPCNEEAFKILKDAEDRIENANS